MTKFAIRNKQGEVISKHKTLELANSKLRKIDAVSHSLYADDVDWLTGQEEALQGYNHSISPVCLQQTRLSPVVVILSH